LARDLARTARVLARFGPKLPRLVEAQLIRQSDSEKPEPPRPAPNPALWMALGAGVMALGVWIGTQI
jgi:ubiquinone biosynthesis protein